MAIFGSRGRYFCFPWRPEQGDRRVRWEQDRCSEGFIGGDQAEGAEASTADGDKAPAEAAKGDKKEGDEKKSTDKKPAEEKK